jgi:hypothetical protein
MFGTTFLLHTAVKNAWKYDGKYRVLSFHTSHKNLYVSCKQINRLILFREIGHKCSLL